MTGDPLNDPIPEDQTRLGDDALTLHELAAASAAAEQRDEIRKRSGVLYGRETLFRRAFRALRRPR